MVARRRRSNPAHDDRRGRGGINQTENRPSTAGPTILATGQNSDEMLRLEPELDESLLPIDSLVSAV
jgi:hypothetical protein